MMNGHLINKTQYDFFAKHLRSYSGQLKANSSCEWMQKTHRIGYIENGYWFYTEKDRAAILKLVKQQLAVDLLFDAYPAKQTRVVNSETESDEKRNALAVSHDFVLVNALTSLQVNKQRVDISLLETLGVYINAKEVNSIEHKAIILVENLSVMANLQRLVLTKDAAHLKDALWVYRGDKKEEQTTGSSYDFFRRFKSTHQLVCFADFDPAGFHIAMTSGATQLLAPRLDAFQFIEVRGTEQEYYDQDNAKKYLNKQLDLSSPLGWLYKGIKEKKQTIQQEHILSHQIPLSVYHIS